MLNAVERIEYTLEVAVESRGDNNNACEERNKINLAVYCSVL